MSVAKVRKYNLHRVFSFNLYSLSLRSRRYSRAQGGKLEIPPAQKLGELGEAGSWVTERSDWLEYRFEFMIDRKNTSSVYLRNWNQLVLILDVAA